MACALAACGGGGGGGGGSANQSPTASFTATPAAGTAPLLVAFDASASTDPDGTIATYAWNFGDGSTSSAANATANHTYAAIGTYTATLTVTDNDGATSQTTRTLQATAQNLPPTAAFQFVPNGGTAPLVAYFDGSPSSDPEGPIASYTWDFGDGSGTVVGKSPSHTFATAGTYSVQLTVLDPQGLAATSTQMLTVTAGGGAGTITVSGRITYERVPFAAGTTDGLSYAGTMAAPAREVVVELLPVGGGLALATTITDSSGNYAFAAPTGTNAFVRARAQTQRGTTPERNIRVLDNTGGNTLYVLDGSAFNTGTSNQTRNLLAASGWGGAGYTSIRAAAPFAILDTLFSAVEFVLDNGSPALDLPALDVFWSPMNNPSDGDVTTGAIVTTLYREASPTGPPAGIYVLGFENTDTDEYDEHVLAHEFQHFLEDAISRVESPGGQHSGIDRLDLRLAFSEGFANAFSAMVLANALYSDSIGAQQGQRFSFSIESNSATPAGWFNESSIQSLAWDLYDAVADGPDAVAIGYQPMYEVLTGPLRTGPALTSVYPFIDALKAQAGAPDAAIDALLSSQGIHVSDIYGAGETNSGSVAQALPIYTTITLNGGTQAVCGTTAAGTFNKIGNRLFLRFTLGSTRDVSIQVLYTAQNSTAPFSPAPDPDIVLYRSGFLARSELVTANQEILTRTLEAGEYVIEVYEWSHIDPSYSAAERRGNTCFNVAVTG